jgi:hypothetical protein
MPDVSDSAPLSRVVPGPSDLRHYPAHNLIAWQPQGILDDSLLDEIGEWLCNVEKVSPQFQRFVDLGRLTQVAVRTDHVFEFARNRAEQLAGLAPVKSAVLSRRLGRFWHCPSIRRADGENADQCPRLSRSRAGRCMAGCASRHLET